MSSRLSASCYQVAHRTLAQSAVASVRPSCGRVAPQRIAATVAACSPHALLRLCKRDYNVNGNEVKAGSTIKWEGKTYVVLETVVNMRGRAHTTYNLELKDVSTGSKISARVRPADKIEVIEMQTARYNFLYRQGTSLFFMDPTSFEQVELDASLAPGRSAQYLIENSSIALVKDGDLFVGIKVPEKIVCTVESTQAARTKQTNDTTGKEAKLTNGITIFVPNHIEVGQHIIVNTSNDTFTGKSDTPPEPEKEKEF